MVVRLAGLNGILRRPRPLCFRLTELPAVLQIFARGLARDLLCL
jgi:hypothetical protein